MADAGLADFERAIEGARAEGDLGRANVVGSPGRVRQVDLLPDGRSEPGTLHNSHVEP